MKFCYLKKNRVLPKNKSKEEREYTYDITIDDSYLNETIECATCRYSFTLKDNQILAFCGGCNKFMHCGIAGSCVGPNCTHIIDGEVYRQTWCKKCVPKTVIINLLDMGEGKSCLCQECLDDPKTPSCYKRKI